ncbi:Uncharacterised protein [uncultured Eubacterium sp.]|jgi:hypothetical protein|nr:Uncharacterised protein [uncultured Eubacterium sp.]
MTNLDKMKENVIEQIKEMGIEEFENLLNCCDSFNVGEDSVFNCENIFPCTACREFFGYCGEENHDAGYNCLGQFEKYARMEVTK